MLINGVPLYKLITASRLNELEKAFGVDKDGLIKPIEFSVNTDRDDPFLCKNVIDFSIALRTAADILDISLSELITAETTRDFKQSDHETVVHSLDFNNNPCIGGIVEFDDEFYEIESFDYKSDIVNLVNINNKEETKVIGLGALNSFVVNNWNDHSFKRLLNGFRDI